MERELCRTYVDPLLKERFYRRFGDKTLSFVVETSMRELLDMTDGAPDLEDLVRLSIRNHVLSQRSQDALAELPVLADQSTGT